MPEGVWIRCAMRGALVAVSWTLMIKKKKKRGKSMQGYRRNCI